MSCLWKTLPTKSSKENQNLAMVVRPWGGCPHKYIMREANTTLLYCPILVEEKIN
jgi:hypothetical protein